MAKISLFEQLVYATLGRLMARSAQITLLSRELKFENGAVGRWLKPDIDRYRQAASRKAFELRDIDAPRPGILGGKIMVEMTVQTMANYRALRNAGIERACAIQLVADIVWRIYSSMLRLYSWPFRLTTRDPSRRISRTIKALLWFPFNAPGAPDYAVQHWEKNGNTYTHFTHCPPQSFVRALITSEGDHGELNAFRESWCRYDWPGADILADDGLRGHYERRQTLSHGDGVCDMCWRGRVKRRAVETQQPV
ncbi:hypothetical protein [Hyphobacterium sp.]|uniref:hypothetical protein n=1 Tax=Hyphobacterium sp. TaxID=2004662 RepID=UPI003BABAB2D